MSNKTDKVFAFSFSQIITLIINFLVSPYLARSLSKTDYSNYYQVVVYVNLTSVLFSLGLQSVVFYFFSKKSPYQNQILSTLQFLILGAASIAASALFCFSFLLGSSSQYATIADYLRICSLGVFLSPLNNYFISILIYNGNAKKVALISVLTTIFSVSFIFISLHIWNSVKSALFFSQVMSPLLSAVLTFLLSYKFANKSIKYYSSSVKEIFKSSLPLYFTSLLGSSYIYISSFFIIFLLGDISYANYRNGAVEIPFISTIAFSVSAVLLPELNNFFHSNNKHAALELKKKIINQCIFLLYPVIVFFIIYSKEFIVSYFSEKYIESAIIFAIYSCTCLVRINDYQDVLITAGKSSYILRANIIYFFINLVLVVLLGKLFGIIGVAVAACFSVFMLAYILLKKDAEIFGIKILNFFQIKNILLLAVFSVFAAIFLKYLLSMFHGIGYLKTFLIGAAIYFPSVYFFILKKGFLLPSVLDLIKKRVPGAALILSNKS